MVLRHLYQMGGLTRSELAEKLGIRKNTVGTICDALLSQGRILKQDLERKRNSRVMLNPEAYFAVGVDHCVDILRIALFDAAFSVVLRSEVAFEGQGQDIRVRMIVKCIREMIGRSGISTERIAGIGFSDFVPHNTGPGLRMKSVWMPDWGDINIKADLERDLGLKACVMRCTDALAMAEHTMGSCRDGEPFCVVQLDKGIGLSVFRDGTFQTGSTGIFGEMGHTVCREGGDICKCGNRGCLETFAGTSAIVRKVRENIGNDPYFQTRDSSSDVTFDDIVSNAVEGNKLALLVLNEATKAIGDAIASVVNILGIMRVVLYGELAKAGELLVQQVTSSIRSHCIYPLNQTTRVWTSSLDPFASAAGAAHLVFERYFDAGADAQA
jgi:predicted NBD/HSP70 family sugar kinase